MQIMSREEQLLYKQLLRLANGDALLVERAIRKANREQGKSSVTLDAILESLAILKAQPKSPSNPPQQPRAAAG